MKILALLSIWLALPLAAEVPAATALTQEEHESLTLAYIQLQNAEIALYQAQEAYKTGTAELAKKHGACMGAQWIIAKKEWSCP